MRFMGRLCVIAMAMFMLSACSGGMTTGTDASKDSNNNGQGGNGGQVPAPVQNIDYKGYAAASEYEGIKMLDLDKTAGELIVSVPLGMDSSILIGGGSVSSLPGVTFSTVLGGDGKTYLQVRVPLKYVLRGVNTTPPGKLPNGDALPMMPAGEAAKLGFQIATNNNNVRNVYLYVGVDAIGIYAESPWVSCYGLPVCLTSFSFPIKNQSASQILGYFSLVMPKADFLGGFFVSSKMPPEIAAILDDYFIE